jgi:hypothetical protein
MSDGSNTWRHRGLRAFRLAVGALLLGFLLLSVDWDEAQGIIREADWHLLILSTMMLWATLIPSAVRWYVLLAERSSTIGFARLLSLYHVGAFFNVLLPTSLGGDVVRIYGVGKAIGDHSVSAAVVLAERMLGLMALSMMALPALVLNPAIIDQPIVVIALVAVFSGLLLSGGVISSKRALRWIMSLIDRLNRKRLSDLAQRFLETLRILGGQRRRVLAAFAITAFAQIVNVSSVVALGSGLGLEVSPWFYFVAVPAVWVITLAPLSINGMGVREWSYVFFFSTVGVGSAGALLLSLVATLQMVVIAIIGGLVYAVSGSVDLRKEILPESQ